MIFNINNDNYYQIIDMLNEFNKIDKDKLQRNEIYIHYINNDIKRTSFIIFPKGVYAECYDNPVDVITRLREL